MAVTASAAVSAGLASPRACEAFAVVSDVTFDLLCEERPIPRAWRCRGRRDHRAVFCQARQRSRFGIRRGPLRAPCPSPAGTAFGPCTDPGPGFRRGLTGSRRPLYSAGFATSRLSAESRKPLWRNW